MDERRSGCKDCLEVNLIKKDIEIQNGKIEGMVSSVEKITNKLEFVGRTLVSVNDSIQFLREANEKLCDDIKQEVNSSRAFVLKVERMIAGEVEKSVVTVEDRQVINFMRKVEGVADSALFKIGVLSIFFVIGLVMYMIFSKGFLGMIKI